MKGVIVQTVRPVPVEVMLVSVRPEHRPVMAVSGEHVLVKLARPRKSATALIMTVTVQLMKT